MFFRHFTDFPLAVVLINEKTELKKMEKIEYYFKKWNQIWY